MSNHYDNWERLVEAVLRRQHDREIALCPSTNSSPSSSRSSSFDSEFYDQLHAAIIKYSNSQIFPFPSATMVKIVVMLSMNDEKSRTKALKLTVEISGIQSVALAGAGAEKSQLVVVGECIDAVELLQQLRKGVGYAELVSVGRDGANMGQVAAPAEAWTVPVPIPPRAPPGLPARVYTFFKERVRKRIVFYWHVTF
ncbi:uncharacterized protein LOC125192827 [Salvia hispanica]|uniref:uncharacterized protein LOC125192827 n=1 Tax=Salvia hispanica TaxID=49212 RepID=UPI0020093024|nr:uncharacterized protein LOC125192827 [Salvia hispanica]